MTTELHHVVDTCQRCGTFEKKRWKLLSYGPFWCLPLWNWFILTSQVLKPRDINKPSLVDNVLVMMDHFTHYMKAFITHNQKAKTVARVLYDHFISICGAPKKMLHDCSTNFIFHIVQALSDIFGIKKIKTTPYHTQCNGQVKCFHQTLMQMAGKVWYDHKAD